MINISLLVSGASGIPIFIKLLQVLLKSNQCLIKLVFTRDALITFAQETGISLSALPNKCKEILVNKFDLTNKDYLTIYQNNDWNSTLASGSSSCHYNIVCPCSMATLAKIAHGIGDNLLTRAVDVAIKENKNVILVPRETPLSSIHLENMLKLSKISRVSIIPPVVAFYNHPKTVDDIILFMVAKILDQIIEIKMPRLIKAWGTSDDQ